MSRRVLVTGMGLLSPLGEGADAHREAWQSGRSLIAPVSLIDASPFPCRVAGEVQGFRAKRYVDNRKNLKLMTRAVRLGVAAAHLAVEDAGEALLEVAPERIAVFVGAPHAYGAAADLLPALERATADDRVDLVAFGRDGLSLVNPLWLLKGLSNNVLGFVSQRYGARGPNANLSGSGAGGAQAIGEAFRAVRDGRAEVALAGGYDSLVCVEALTGYSRLGCLTSANERPEQASRPFDSQRDGFVPSEGGAFLVLEAEDRVKARGAHARIHGELLGAGDACDAFDAVAPEPEGRGVLLAARAALRCAGLRVEDLSFVVAHASGSQVFDPVESSALRALMAGTSGELPVTAPKGAMGHTVAASGAFGAAAALLAMAAGAVPPTANLDEPDAACGLRHVRGRPLPLEPQAGKAATALVNAAGLGGQVTSLVLGACQRASNE